MLSFPILFAQSQGSSGSGAVGSQLLFFGLLFAAMWFLMIAPQRKKQKQHDQMLRELGKGDEVVSSGGIIGTIVAVKEDRFMLRVADSTTIELGKSFVSSVLNKADK
jgi:preprotein translocase subunit YajC